MRCYMIWNKQVNLLAKSKVKVFWEYHRSQLYTHISNSVESIKTHFCWFLNLHWWRQNEKRILAHAQWLQMLVPLSLVSYSAAALMFVFCSITIADSYLIKGRLRRQNLKDSNCIRSVFEVIFLEFYWRTFFKSSLTANETRGSYWVEVPSN